MNFFLRKKAVRLFPLMHPNIVSTAVSDLTSFCTLELNTIALTANQQNICKYKDSKGK